MHKFISYPLSIIFYLCFGLTLVIFHPIQWFCFNVFGYQAHKKSVDSLQFWIMRCLNLIGTRFTFHNPYNIGTEQPLIIVANHQSTYDIPPIIWYMRKHHCKFISKKELGKGIPSVSYNLKHGGSVLIDRKSPRQSLTAISEFAKRIHKNNWAAVIFPEGSRSRDGNPKPFKTSGLQLLIKEIPEALVVPITINNSWKTMRFGTFPMGLGAHIKFEVHTPIKVSEYDIATITETVEQQIIDTII